MAFDHRGVVKNWNDQRGFGFITTDQGEDVFAHLSAFSKNVLPKPGMRVLFDIETGPRGKRAPRVVLDG